MMFRAIVFRSVLFYTLAWFVAAPASAATLVNRYSFTADASDSIGGANGSIVGGASISGGAAVLDGSSGYVDLPNGIISTLNSFTIEVWLTDNNSGTWANIFDFGNSTGGEDVPGTSIQSIYLTPQSGGGILHGGITTNGSTTEYSLEWSGTRLPAGTLKHIVWAGAPISGTTNRGRLYVDGVNVAVNSLVMLKPSDLGFTLNNWIGRSQWSNDPYLNASITEFRIYSGALTATEVATDFNNGPDVVPQGPVQFGEQPQSQTVPELSSVTFTTTYGGTPPVAIQWQRNGVDIPGATNNSLTVFAALTNNSAAYSVVLTNSYLGTPYTVTSTNAILGVTADTTPPVLVSAASLSSSEVDVAFTEGLSDATGTNVANYVITRPGGSLVVTAARFGTSPAEIILTTATQVFGTNYTVTVNNVRDRSVAANLIAPNSQASFIAMPFFAVNIGKPAIGGTQTLASGGLNITAAGNGISGPADQFTFSYQTYTNNFDVRVRVAAQTLASSWTRAGLMARNGTASNAMFAASFASPGPAGCHFSARTTAGGSATMAGQFPVNYPDTWLRLRRTGNVFDGFASFDGQTWAYLGASTIAMSNLVQVGFAVTSGNPGATTTAQIRDFGNASGAITTNAALPFEPLGACSRRTALVISEIMYHPPAAWPGGDDLEFVELWNSGLVTEDLTDHRLEGEIDYLFPAGTKIAPGQFLVVAKNPGPAQSFYGGPFLGPYTNKLNDGGGTLRLINEIGGRLLEISYDNKAPWPVAPDGTGHSLVLSRPSYGEGDPRAWSASDDIGGSPGAFEHYGSEPARGVVINEFLAHTDPPQEDYIELFNTRLQAVNLSGVWLSDTASTNKYRLINGTTIAARGRLVYTQTALGFALNAEGEKIFLVNSNQTRVLDAVNFDGQENGVSTGRYPDGAPGFQRLATVTQGTANSPPRLPPVVINEIMYHPISEDDNDEYVELYNRSGGAVNLGGWQLQDGVNFTFPPNTIIPAGGYMVVAGNLANLLAKNPQLDGNNAVGNFSGKLANGGERIALAMPDEIITGGATNIFTIPVNEVTYADGGRWGQWSDGGGSSLELRDSDADNRLAANWADSDESAKAPWTTINETSVMENGHTGAQGVANRFEFFFHESGEALVDDLAFLTNGVGNQVANSGFESGASGWTMRGVLRNSYVQSGVGIGGSAALHVVSTGRGDAGANKIVRALASTAPTGAPNTGTIRASVRWLKGSPYILLRPRGHWMEVSRRLNVPDNLGTPGLANSRSVANAGPAITEVSHAPVLPVTNQPVVVTARVSDPDGISSLQLLYRFDPTVSYSAVDMFDNGTGGDAVAADGIYSATISAQASGTMVAFFVTATDATAATSQFPAQAPTRECLVRWGETLRSGTIGNYRLWLTAANLTFWNNREQNANDTMDATFIYGNQRVIYGVNTMYAGSPFHSGSFNGPTGSYPCDYEINFQPDEKFLGSGPFVVQGFDTSSGGFDATAQVDATGNWVARKLGQPYNHHRQVHMFLNGLARGTIYDDVQQPNAEFIAENFPDENDDQLRKIEDWFEFADNTDSFNNVDGTITRYNKSTGEIDNKRYRWNWRPRATPNPDDWAPFISLVTAVNDSTSPDYVARVKAWMDLPNFFRPSIAHHIAGDWDAYGFERGKNMYAYKSADHPWRLLMWDIEFSFGQNSRATNDSIYNINDVTFRNFIMNTPAFNREWLRGYADAINTALAPGVAAAIVDERYASYQLNGASTASPTGIKNYINGRRAYLQGVIPSANFVVSNAAFQTVTASNTLALTGTAPLAVENIVVNGKAYAVTWTSTTAWRVLVPLVGATNVLAITATDRFGNLVTNATGNVTANYTGVTVAPEGFMGFNEIMFQPAVPGAAFVELFNSHSNYTFDLSGWNVNGLGYTFPAGAAIAPGKFLVLAEDTFIYGETYGVTNVAFAPFPGRLGADGETLTLFRPGAGTNTLVVDRVRYEAVPPWPTPSNGVSLQLVDAAEDNSRVANWQTSSAGTNVVATTPQWVKVTRTGTLFNNANAFYLYLGSAGDIYIDDIVLVSGSVAESGANRLANGNFETALTGPWAVSANFVGTALSTSVKHGGSSSLHLVATAAGSGNNNSISQSLSPSLGAFGTYTLSYWYLQTTNGSPLIVRLANSTASSGVYTSVNPLIPGTTTNLVIPASPGAANRVATNLPPFPPLWLNEAQANNVTGPLDNFGQHDPWTELFNPGGTNVNLSGYYLSDNYSNLTKWPFPVTAAASNGFTLVWCDNQTNQTTAASFHAGFTLASGNGSLALSRIVNGSPQIVDYLNYSTLPANWSYGDVPDGQPFYRSGMFYPTPGATNSALSAPLYVSINEWLADNVVTLTDPADANYEDWFELYNPGTNAVDLGGYYLTDDLTNKFKFQIPNNGHYVIPGQGYLLVWADNESAQNATNRADLHVNFALSKGGEAIGLFAADGTVIDAITFGAQTTDVSEGRFPNGVANIYSMPTPTPRAANIVPNSAPTLAFISNQVVTLGHTLFLTAVGSDTDFPAQTLTYSLPTAPGSANIGPVSGAVTWTPSIAPATNLFTVMVADNGTPGLSAVRSFNVVTAPVPAVSSRVGGANLFTMSWSSFAGQKFQVDFKDDLDDPSWTPISPVLTGTGGPMSYNIALDDPLHRFFRLRVVP